MTVSRLKRRLILTGPLKKSTEHLLNGFHERVDEKMVLGQVSVCSVLHEFGKQGIISLSGQNYYGNLLIHFPDLLKCVQAIEFVLARSGKNMIQNDESRVQMKILQTLLPGMITDHLIVMPALKGKFHQIQYHFVIIDKENRLAHEGYMLNQNYQK